MAHIVLPKVIDLSERVRLMQEDARFEMTDADADCAGLASIRASVRSRRALPKVPKSFLTNDCIFNCAYCDCREGNEGRIRYASTPRELAEVSLQQANRTRSGIFITSAIHQSPDYTEELIIRTLKILRLEMGYRGYIHAKVMPGTDPLLIAEAGRYANRLSVNIEVAHSEGYRRIARNKNKGNILTPMGQISAMIAQAKQERGRYRPAFATTQTTQMMAGSIGEDDYTILNLSGALYRRYNLSRVYYTAFQYTHCAREYEHLPPVTTPPWRMHRIYQADRLMQLYGFTAEEIAPPGARYLEEALDPKAAWALRNMHLFPVEVNRADLQMLLRVPGIGPTYAKRILVARRDRTLTHEMLQKLGISLKRCRHFITCNGRFATGSTERVEQLSLWLKETAV